MIKKRRRLFSMGVVATAASLFLSGCQHAALLNPKGTVASEEVELLVTAVLLMLIIVVPVIVLTFVIARRYRSSNKDAKYQPDFHSTALEVFWWIVPIIIIAILATITWKTTHQLDPYRPLDSKKKPLTIQVVSLNWRWLFIYPEQRIATVNFVEFPVDRPVNFQLTSDAPMNSFMIHQLGGQIYSMAGMRTKLSLLATQPGDYEGVALGFSGEGFENMHFTARVVDQRTFDIWASQVKRSPNILTFDVYNRTLSPDSKDTSVLYFNLGDANLFGRVLGKFMDPSMKMSNA